MKLHDLRPPAGSNRARRRVGRGIGGKGGKTAGRGTKGQHARNTVKPGFEGGQLPLAQRIPKLKGFHNPFRVAYAVVNLDTLENFAGQRGHARHPGGGRPGPQGGPGQGARPGRAAPGAAGRGPRRVGQRPAGHRGRRWPGGVDPASLRPRTAACRGVTRSPTGSLYILGIGAGCAENTTRRGGALEPQEHLQGSGPAQQGRVHPRHHRALPARGEPHRPLCLHQGDPAARDRRPSRRGSSAS